MLKLYNTRCLRLLLSLVITALPNTGYADTAADKSDDQKKRDEDKKKKLGGAGPSGDKSEDVAIDALAATGVGVGVAMAGMGGYTAFKKHQEQSKARKRKASEPAAQSPEPKKQKYMLDVNFPVTEDSPDPAQPLRDNGPPKFDPISALPPPTVSKPVPTSVLPGGNTPTRPAPLRPGSSPQRHFISKEGTRRHSVPDFTNLSEKEMEEEQKNIEKTLNRTAKRIAHPQRGKTRSLSDGERHAGIKQRPHSKLSEEEKERLPKSSEQLMKEEGQSAETARAEAARAEAARAEAARAEAPASKVWARFAKIFQ
jgi:hypothetical protein